MRLRFISLLFLFTLLIGCSNNEGDAESKELTIAAAASLVDALQEAKEEFEKSTHIKINYSFGSSGALQEQIIQGAPIDLFFSAAEDKFNSLVDQGFINKEESANILRNELVLIVPKENNNAIHTFSDLVHATRVAIGTPESVPAGKYAKESLESMNLWGSLHEKLILGKDVRQVLTYVETNNVDAGIVYKTDALLSDKVEAVATAVSETHIPIVYPLGVINNSKNYEEAILYFQYLQSEQAMNIFKKHGFKTY